MIAKPAPILDGCEVLPPIEAAPVAQDNLTKAKAGPAKRKSAGERFRTLNAFADACLIGLSRVEIAAWLILYRDTRDGIACASEDSIAKRAGCTKRAVTTAIGKLRRRGLVVQIYKGGINRGPSRYRVLAKPPKRLGKCASS